MLQQQVVTRGAALGSSKAACSAHRSPAAVSHRRRHVGKVQAFETLATPQVVADAAAVTNATYATLGLAGASFVGTFFVAPRFKDSFKEDIDWRDMYKELVAAGGVASVTPREAFNKSRSCVLADVRLPGKYAECHADGAVSLPLYIPIQRWDLPSIIRRVGFAFFGIYGTELNTKFAEEVSAVVPKGRQIILICENGGSLQNKSGTMFGFQSRSLKAAYYLQKAGYKVSYVQGGLAMWQSEGLPLAQGAEDLDDTDDDDGEVASAPAGRLQLLFGGLGR